MRRENRIKSLHQYRRQREIFDRGLIKYEQYFLENWRLSYIKQIFAELKISFSSLVNAKDPFLDIGVGRTGYTVIEAARFGLYSVGVDLSSEAMKKAAQFARNSLGSDKYRFCEFIICSAEFLPFKKRVFSKIASVALLEHLPNDNQAIREISRVIRRKGRCFLSVPNTFERIYPILRIPYRIHDKRVGHLRHYKAEELIIKFQKNNFESPEIYYTGHLIKIIQFLLGKLFPQITKLKSGIWWVLEKIDIQKYRKVPTGVTLNIIISKR